MHGQWFGNFSNRNLNKNKLSTSSPSTGIADSGIASRTTPLSSINDTEVCINPAIDDDDDNESIVTENQCLSFNFIELHKPILIYKKCEENMQYSNCLVTYLDHPSAIFIQTPDDGPVFQQMHQDMNRHYMDNLCAYSNISVDFFQTGNFCVAYSSRYFEFFRARILTIDHTKQQCLIIYVDFGNSEWIHSKSLRPIHCEFAQLQIQSVAITLSHIVPKKDLITGAIHWNSHVGKQCTRKLRRWLIQPESEPFVFVTVRILSNENWWPLSFVDIKLNGQDLAEMLHIDGLARLTRHNRDLKMIYPHFGRYSNEQLIYGIDQCENHFP